MDIPALMRLSDGASPPAANQARAWRTLSCSGIRPAHHRRVAVLGVVEIKGLNQVPEPGRVPVPDDLLLTGAPAAPARTPGSFPAS